MYRPRKTSPNGHPQSTPGELLDELADLLRLAKHGIGITAIRLRGTGPTASLEVDLTTDTIEAPTFGDLYTAAGLSKWVTQSVGINARGITSDEASEASAIIRQLARITRDRGAADFGREHGLMFLALAPLETFTLNDRQDRYRAFSKLDRLDPAGRARDEASITHVSEAPEIARNSLVLLDRTSGWRYVHCGHLWSMVHALRDVGSANVHARQMTAAGWEKSGRRGDIKATSPAPRSRTIHLTLWRVPAAWEAPDTDDDDEDLDDLLERAQAAVDRARELDEH